ncbi:MAG: DUF1653 domain-containing protein [Lachnospiraceae bacterium]|nr:DUF1653 domain-containing protein [Lachnospiraceae bacterium]
MKNNPKPYEIYEHFKGNKYQIITLAQHSETGEEMVVYQALYGDYKMYVRPLSMFLAMVDQEKYPEYKGRHRFQKVSAEHVPAEDMKASEQEVQSEVMEPVKEQDKEEAAASRLTDSEKKTDEEKAGIDPMVMDFLDADTYEERLNILAALHHRITDDMINTMAISIDVEIEDGPIETRYEELKHCLVTFQKYQCIRIR